MCLHMWPSWIKVRYCANYTCWQRSFTLEIPDVAAVWHQEPSRLPRGRAREINKFPTAESTSTPCEFRWLKRISRVLDALVIKKMITLLYSIRRSTVISMFEPVFNKRQHSQWVSGCHYLRFTVNARISFQLQISAPPRISAPPKAQNL